MSGLLLLLFILILAFQFVNKLKKFPFLMSQSDIYGKSPNQYLNHFL